MYLYNIKQHRDMTLFVNQSDLIEVTDHLESAAIDYTANADGSIEVADADADDVAAWLESRLIVFVLEY